MNKSNTCIYLLSRFAAFNQEHVPQFENFAKDTSKLLFSSLFMNYKTILDENSGMSSIYYCIDDKDRDFLPAELADKENIIWLDNNNKTSCFIRMSEKYFSQFNNNLIITSDSIGITVKDIKKIFDLLAIEDEAMVLGKSDTNKVCFTGFNRVEANFFKEFNFDELDYNKALNAVCRQNTHLHVMENYLIIENMEDFKKLYTELSKKESLAYCNQAMHEEFTHLFIEYKDLLK